MIDEILELLRLSFMLLFLLLLLMLSLLFVIVDDFVAIQKLAIKFSKNGVNNS